jgi:hypothetical protein
MSDFGHLMWGMVAIIGLCAVVACFAMWVTGKYFSGDDEKKKPDHGEM